MSGAILTYDSGLGGLTVFRHVVEAFPDADHIYVADDEVFPIGEWEDQALVEHCVSLMGRLIEEHQPALVVIACNTASTLILEPLRQAHDIAFVGTVPAIKPAAEQTKSGLVSVLATPGTIKRDYTKALMETYASHCDVTLVGSVTLARLAEQFMASGEIDETALADEIAPCFIKRDGLRSDVVVLGCTHYPLLLPLMNRVAPWPVTYIDPGPAIARRVQTLLPPGLTGHGKRVFIKTSGGEFPGAVVASYAVETVETDPIG